MAEPAYAPSSVPTEYTEEGVALHDPHDYSGRRMRIYDGMEKAFKQSLPHSYGGVTLKLKDGRYMDEPHPTPDQVQEALAKNQFLGRRYRGTLELYDDATGALLDSKTQTLFKAPVLTDLGTFIHGGSDWALTNQARLLPGIYHRKTASGIFEAHANVRRGTGPSLRVQLEPETGLFKLNVGQTSLRLYSLLKELGHPDEDLKARWGEELWQKNADKFDRRTLDKAYARLVKRPNLEATKEQKVQEIRDALSATKVGKSVLKHTLPQALGQ